MIKSNENQKPRKWYTNYTFPLVPVICYRNADENNTFSWYFHWMFFKVWTRDAFDFEIALTVDTHWGIGVTALLPYLRIAVCIPCPEWLGMKIQRYLWRHPESMKTFNTKEK